MGVMYNINTIYHQDLNITELNLTEKKMWVQARGEGGAPSGYESDGYVPIPEDENRGNSSPGKFGAEFR